MKLVTEQEAFEMWCPLGRVQGANGGYNRNELEDGSAFDVPMASPCIGSLCMAWRGETVGYCGAFGKVEP